MNCVGTWGKRGAVLALCAMLAAGLCGCTRQTAAPEDTGPVVIQMYGKLDEAYLPFLDALAAQFPEAELRYEYQWDQAGILEAQRRMLHGDGPDLAVVSGEAMVSMAEEGLLLDLTGEPFSTRYHVSAMTALNDEGRVLGLPLPNDLRCLVCNRTILEENGIAEVPRTVPELLAVSRTLTERGQGAILADGDFYHMLLRESYLSKPEGYDWLTAYNKGEGTMAGTPAADAWDTYAALAEVSGCTPEDATAVPAARTTMMLEGKYAFRSTNIANLKFMQNQEAEGELIALPFPGQTEKDGWVFYDEAQNMRYFVGNGALDAPEHGAKRDLVLRMLDWISTEEAQKVLAGCSNAAISYVDGVKLEQGEAVAYMEPVMAAGRLTSSQQLARGVGDAVSDCAARILAGELTGAEAVAVCDGQNTSYVPPQEIPGLDEVIGSAVEHIYWRKPAAVTVGAPMTQLAAQAMAEAYPEADFAFAMAKNTASTFYPGDITLGDAVACANGEGDRELMLVQATGAQIQALISAGVGSPTEPTLMVPYGIAGAGRLLHPVGLTYQADVTREKGDKVTRITLDGGGALDMDGTYTIIVSGLLVDGVAEPNLSGCEAVSAGKRLRDVLVDYIRAHGRVSAPEVGFTIQGAPAPLYTLP